MTITSSALQGKLGVTNHPVAAGPPGWNRIGPADELLLRAIGPADGGACCC